MLLSLLLKVVVVVGPVYYDNYMANKVVDGLVKDLSHLDKTSDQMSGDLSLRFSINNITLPLSDFVCTHDDQGYHIAENYEVRKNLIGNLDVIVHFNRTFESQGAPQHS
ncbi:MAG: DUF4845 domain-containing protein [Pseudomonadales bacterium]|nr:DUF4845 domain-containing protein [Pseudomonadales bacterium]